MFLHQQLGEKAGHGGLVDAVDALRLAGEVKRQHSRTVAAEHVSWTNLRGT
uniref:Uncharacterized protein n=1 Tax=Oryza sativa subsp. japonica TaxID=39947 RepID=Q5JCW2_ORYSJ|nr:hypothetical protein [Oryza sativa Japonica Group]